MPEGIQRRFGEAVLTGEIVYSPDGVWLAISPDGRTLASGSRRTRGQRGDLDSSRGQRAVCHAPNPFNAGTGIAYRLADPGAVRLEIYNLMGQPVHTLVDQVQTAGVYQVSWNGRDHRGAAVAAGIYLARLSYPGGVQARRLIYLK